MEIEDQDRRSFFRWIVPACFGTYVGMRSMSALAQTKQKDEPQDDEHKFNRRMTMPLTWKQYFETEYVSHFIPYLKILEQELGKERVISSLKTLAAQEAERFARDFVEAKGRNDLSVFKYYGPDTPGIKDILTIRVVEDTERAYEIEITECLWAKIFRDADAADFGAAAVCSGDVPFARSVNPNVDLDLRGTIMQGEPTCRLRYFTEP